MTFKELIASGASEFLTSEVILEILVNGKIFRASLSDVETTDPITCKTCDTSIVNVVLKGVGDLV